MFLILLKGLPGCGKSTIGRELGRHLGWSTIDKDDILDVLHEQESALSDAARLAYEVMFRVARRQLMQRLSVIIDSPLLYLESYENAQAIARETHASLAIIECRCEDQEIWRRRIEGRQGQEWGTHRVTNWEQLQSGSQQVLKDHYSAYPIQHPHLAIDTTKPLDDCIDEIIDWLEHLPTPALPVGL